MHSFIECFTSNLSYTINVMNWNPIHKHITRTNVVYPIKVLETFGRLRTKNLNLDVGFKLCSNYSIPENNTASK